MTRRTMRGRVERLEGTRSRCVGSLPIKIEDACRRINRALIAACSRYENDVDMQDRLIALAQRIALQDLTDDDRVILESMPASDLSLTGQKAIDVAVQLADVLMSH